MIDQAYIAARRGLLDALDALTPHHSSIVLVGAQAIYVHTGSADLAIAEYTTDADLAIDPSLLMDEPDIETLMRTAGLTPDRQRPGIWITRTGVPVDLLVPESVGGPGRRGARLGRHGRTVARKSQGLEGILVDRAPHVLNALDAGDDRATEIDVAGPTALLVAKLHKIRDRLRDRPDRASDKDALDVLRLLRAVRLETCREGLGRMRIDERSSAAASAGLVLLGELFGEPTSAGSVKAGRSLAGLENPDEIATSASVLANDLLEALA